MRRDPRALFSKRLLGNLNQDFLAFLQKVGNRARVTGRIGNVAIRPNRGTTSRSSGGSFSCEGAFRSPIDEADPSRLFCRRILIVAVNRVGGDFIGTGDADIAFRRFFTFDSALDRHVRFVVVRGHGLVRFHCRNGQTRFDSSRVPGLSRGIRVGICWQR